MHLQQYLLDFGPQGNTQISKIRLSTVETPIEPSKIKFFKILPNWTFYNDLVIYILKL